MKQAFILLFSVLAISSAYATSYTDMDTFDLLRGDEVLPPPPPKKVEKPKPIETEATEEITSDENKPAGQKTPVKVIHSAE